MPRSVATDFGAGQAVHIKNSCPCRIIAFRPQADIHKCNTRILPSFSTIQRMPPFGVRHPPLFRCSLTRAVLGLVSKNRGQRGHRLLPPGSASMALNIIRDRYPDFGPTFACEKLREVHGLTIGRETIRRLMTEAGLWIPRKDLANAIAQAQPALNVLPRPTRH